MSAADDPVKVEPMASARKNSKIARSITEADTVSMSGAAKRCYWNDTEYGQDDRVCDNGVCYECAFGYWVKLDEPC